MEHDCLHYIRGRERPLGLIERTTNEHEYTRMLARSYLCSFVCIRGFYPMRLESSGIVAFRSRESRVSFAERKTTVVLIVVKLFGTSSHVDSCYEIGVSVFGVAVYA